MILPAAGGGAPTIVPLEGAPFIVTIVLVGLGCFLMLVAALGLVRFPDFYSRMHPAGKGDTLGQGLVLAGLIVAAIATGETWVVWMKLVLIILFIFVANPTATHALARAAWITGVKPWIPEPEEAESAAAQQEQSIALTKNTEGAA
jgi:multicomponent Na+:H+ antiporter subunit G